MQLAVPVSGWLIFTGTPGLFGEQVHCNSSAHTVLIDNTTHTRRRNQRAWDLYDNNNSLFLLCWHSRVWDYVDVSKTHTHKKGKGRQRLCPTFWIISSDPTMRSLLRPKVHHRPNEAQLHLDRATAWASRHEREQMAAGISGLFNTCSLLCSEKWYAICWWSASPLFFITMGSCTITYSV